MLLPLLISAILKRLNEHVESKKDSTRNKGIRLL
jgi:hypothetical protein